MKRKPATQLKKEGVAIFVNHIKGLSHASWTSPKKAVLVLALMELLILNNELG
jgi:hypothetical protein